MPGRWRFGRLLGGLELLAQLGNGTVLLLQAIGGLAAGRLLLADILLQVVNLGLMLGDALVHAGRCRGTGRRAGGRRIRPGNGQWQQANSKNQRTALHYR
jgi:hypothetical protein